VTAGRTIQRALRALALWLGVPLCGACGGAQRVYVCSIDGADVWDFRAPSELGRVQIVRAELYGETRSGKGIVIGCEGYKAP